MTSTLHVGAWLAFLSAAALGGCTRVTYEVEASDQKAAAVSADHVASTTAAAVPDPSSGGDFLLTVSPSGGGATGTIHSVVGGNPSADIVTQTTGSSSIPVKSPGTIRLEPIRIQVGPNMPNNLATWIDSAWRLAGQLDRSGSFSAVSADGRIIETFDFTNARISATTLPAMNSQIDPERGSTTGYVTIDIVPSRVSVNRAEGSNATQPLRQKRWLTSNFRMTVGNLPPTAVTKVDAFTIKQLGVQQTGIGLPVTVSGKLDVSDLVVTVDREAGQAWEAWASASLDDTHPNPVEFSGSIELLDADLSDILARVDLRGVGVRAIRRVPGSNVAQLVLYVESARFTSNP